MRKMPHAISLENPSRLTPHPEPIPALCAGAKPKYSMKTIDKIKRHKAVEQLCNEGDDGWWCYLKEGFIDGESLCNAVHEHTLTAVLRKLGDVRKKIPGDPT